MGFELLEIGLMGSTALGGAMAFYFMQSCKKRKDQMASLEQAFNHLHEGYYRTSLHGKQLSANPALVKLNGYNTEEELLSSVKSISKEWYVDPNRRADFREILMREGNVVNFVSEIYRHKTRERIWISENARLVYHPNSLEPLHYEGTVREITEEVRLRETQDRLAKLAENLPGGLFQFQLNSEGKFQAPYVSESFIRLLNRPATPCTNSPKDYLKFVPKDERNSLVKHFITSIRTLSSIDTTFKYSHSNGSIAWLHMTAKTERLESGCITWHGHIADITVQKLADEKTNKLAYTDCLTNLPKRSVAEDRLRATITQCKRREEYAALLFIDLDNFKALNDVNGHEVGDELLIQVAKRMQGLVRASDLVSRYGGDEFVIIIDNLGNNFSEGKDKAASFATKVQNCFKESFLLGTVEHNSTPSIGVAMIEPDLPEASEIITRADNAMYQAKKNGRNNFVIFGGSNVASANGISSYNDDILGAVERDEFHLVFQPQIDRDSKITGAEAFIRWNHPTKGVLTPGEFMPLAEKNGTIVEINDWVIDQAIMQIAEWESAPDTRDLRLSINLGVQQFSTVGFAAKLEAKLFKSGIARNKLIFELTESVLNRNVDSIRSKMLEVKGCGVSFALDDFGIGSSSLSSLSSLPFDQVKIDGFLISAIESEPQTRNLIDGILGIAKALKLETIAEHVGTKYQETFLHERGCQFAQGYYYFPPMNISEFNYQVEKKAYKPTLVLAG